MLQQLSCCNTCQIWMWFKEYNRYIYKIEYSLKLESPQNANFDVTSGAGDCRNRNLQVSWNMCMMTSSNGKIFRVTGFCAGNSPVTGELPTQRPVTQSFDVFFDLRLNGRWSKQTWGWWFETPSYPLWRHCNGYDLQLRNTLTQKHFNTCVLNALTGCNFFQGKSIQNYFMMT